MDKKNDKKSSIPATQQKTNPQQQKPGQFGTNKPNQPNKPGQK